MVYTVLDAKRELQRRAALEIARRRDTEEYPQAVIAALRADLFPKQLEVLDCSSRRIAMCCSRRAGKSVFSSRAIAIALINAQHNDYILFSARTLQKARNIIWPMLTQINEQYCLGWRCQEHIGEIVTPKGAVMSLLGVDDTKSIEKVRGQKYRLTVCDEAATYEEHLSRLVRDCIEPGTVDFTPRGKIILAGTPGYVRKGFWFDVACGRHPGWKNFFWTLADNPHIKDVDGALADIREANGWDETDPTYQREYLGQWTIDEGSLVYSFVEGRNTTSMLPAPPAGTELSDWIREDWLTTLAADIGFTDAMSIVVLGSPPHSKDIYVLYAHSESGLLVGQQAELIKQARDRYKPTRCVADIGGQGKMVQAEFNARYGHLAGGALLPAPKSGRREMIGMFNSDMRTGVIKAHMPFAKPLVEEWSGLPWADEDKELEHPGFPNHCASAARYGWTVHKSFLAKPAPKQMTASEMEEQRAEARVKRAAVQNSARR